MHKKCEEDGKSLVKRVAENPVSNSRTSPRSRRMNAGLSRPSNGMQNQNECDDTMSMLDRKKLIAPFQKRPPSKERGHGLIVAKRDTIQQATTQPPIHKPTAIKKTNNILYGLIQSSIKSNDLTNKTMSTDIQCCLNKRDKTAFLGRKDNPTNALNKYRFAYMNQAANPEQTKPAAKSNKTTVVTRFFSRRTNPNESKRRLEQQNQPNYAVEKGSRIKERIMKYVYQPCEATATEDVKRSPVKVITKYTLVKNVKGKGKERTIIPA